MGPDLNGHGRSHEPGVGLFYGGLVRSKTVVSMICLSFLALALASVQWILLGYSLSFGTEHRRSY